MKLLLWITYYSQGQKWYCMTLYVFALHIMHVSCHKLIELKIYIKIYLYEDTYTHALLVGFNLSWALIS